MSENDIRRLKFLHGAMPLARRRTAFPGMSNGSFQFGLIVSPQTILRFFRFDPATGAALRS
ncbi:MAG: hypothetical protein LBI68_08760 [Azoarcus sp.]|nr:hypothetical protein [Azoarcus sp.]